MRVGTPFPHFLAYNPQLKRAIGNQDFMRSPLALQLAYLKEMGITVYFPRRALSGARDSLAYAPDSLAPGAQLLDRSTEEQDTARAEISHAMQTLVAATNESGARDFGAQAQTQESGRSAAITSTTSEPGPAPQVEERRPPESEARTEQMPAREDEAPRFAFAFIPVNDRVAAMCELPWSKGAKLTSECRKLLADILRALDVPVEERHLSPMLFTWPLFEDEALGGDAESARQTLEGFLSRRLSLQPVQHLFVFAEQAAHFLFPPSFALEHSARIEHPRFKVNVSLTHSLNAMEAVPALKRPAWQLLQPLKGRLSANVSDQG